MNTKTFLAVPLLAGAVMLQAGISSSMALSAEEPTRTQNPPPSARPREMPPPEAKPQTPPPPPPATPAPVSPSEYPGWMPRHYQMPMHYRMLEPEMIYGYELMTPRERVEYMRRIHSARSFEERERLRFEHHRIMQERARRRHLMLYDMEQPGPGGRWR